MQSTGDAGAVVGRIAILGFEIEDAEGLEGAERQLGDLLGRPMTDDERAQLAAAWERTQQLAREHGPDHHGFGHPAEHHRR